MSFIEEGDEIVSYWDPKRHFQGYRNVLHGGIQATLLDEISSWTVYVKQKTAGVTSRMNVCYLKPVYVDEGSLTIRAKIVEVKRNLVDIETKLYNSKQVLCAQANITYFTFSGKKSQESLYYPDHKAFFEEGQ